MSTTKDGGERLKVAEAPSSTVKRQARISQSDVPSYTVKQAVGIAEVIRDSFGKQPTSPLMVAKALDVSPGSSNFKMLTGAAVAYGLTDGGAQASSIGLTDLGRRAVSPTEDGDDLAAKREAALRPRVIREFLQKYDGSRLPAEKIAQNVIESMGVPAGAAERALRMVISNAEDLGLLQTIKGNRYVMLAGGEEEARNSEELAGDSWGEDDDVSPPSLGRPGDGLGEEATRGGRGPQPSAPTFAPATATANNRVFVSHGRNREVVGQLKEVLTFGGFEPVVSVETETTAKPVPDKVMDDMRSCTAGIVHVGSEMTVMDAGGAEHKMLNPNVLIEIGAALALYRGRLILLVEEGTDLPSNLQGLYQARFAGGKLDYEATMKLLRAFNEFRQQT